MTETLTPHSYTPKILGLMLSYPSEELISAGQAMRGKIKEEKWLSREHLEALDQVFDYFENTDLLDLQECYVDLFDRTPSLALHLFEHVHGDSRDRGQALVDLDNIYRDTGLHNDSEHTPDYLPLFLEYISMLEPEKARSDLDGAINVIGVLEGRLNNRESVYAHVVSALRDMASRAPNQALVKNALKADSGRPMSPEEMDEAWEEQFAFAMNDGEQGSNTGCNAGSSAENMETRS